MHDSETLADEKQVFTACGFIYREVSDGIELFVAKRADTKKFLPGVFELPGGHVDFGEDMKEGLKREMREEFSVDIEVGECFEVFTYMNEIKKSQSLEAIYFAKFISDESDITLNSDDHSEYIWIQSSEISKICNEKKGEDNDEIKVIKKGFAILEGKYNWNI